MQSYVQPRQRPKEDGKPPEKKSHSPSSVLDEKSPPKSRYRDDDESSSGSRKTEEEGKDVEEPSKRKITAKVLTRAMILCNNEDKTAGRNVLYPHVCRLKCLDINLNLTLTILSKDAKIRFELCCTTTVQCCHGHYWCSRFLTIICGHT